MATHMNRAFSPIVAAILFMLSFAAPVTAEHQFQPMDQVPKGENPFDSSMLATCPTCGLFVRWSCLPQSRLA